MDFDKTGRVAIESFLVGVRMVLNGYVWVDDYNKYGPAPEECHTFKTLINSLNYCTKSLSSIQYIDLSGSRIGDSDIPDLILFIKSLCDKRGNNVPLHLNLSDNSMENPNLLGRLFNAGVGVINIAYNYTNFIDEAKQLY